VPEPTTTTAEQLATPITPRFATWPTNCFQTLALPPNQHPLPRNKRLADLRSRRSLTTDPRGVSYVKVAGQVIDVLMAEQRNLAATHRFFTRALSTAHAQPT
jgi:hypothetical protein